MKGASGYIYRRFIYDGSRLLEERDYYNAVVASYVYGPDGQVITRRGASGQDVFYHANSLGSVAALTDSTGAVFERYKYDAYGKPTILDSSNHSIVPSVVGNPLMFAGAYWDGESGNYYMWHREYDPYLGRFLQRDPLGEGASLNLYAYVHGNPINASDPTGLYSSPSAFGQHWTSLISGGQSGSKNCVSGLCGSFSSPWPIGWTSSGAPIYAPSNQSSYFGSFAHLHALTARADVLDARAELGLPAGDPDRGMNGDGTPNESTGSRTHITTQTSGIGPAGPFSTQSEETDGGLFSTDNGHLYMQSGWLPQGPEQSHGNLGQAFYSVFRNTQLGRGPLTRRCQATRAIDEIVKTTAAAYAVGVSAAVVGPPVVEAVVAIASRPGTQIAVMNTLDFKYNFDAGYSAVTRGIGERLTDTPAGYAGFYTGAIWGSLSNLNSVYGWW